MYRNFTVYSLQLKYETGEQNVTCLGPIEPINVTYRSEGGFLTLWYIMYRPEIDEPIGCITYTFVLVGTGVEVYEGKYNYKYVGTIQDYPYDKHLFIKGYKVYQEKTHG